MRLAAPTTLRKQLVPRDWSRKWVESSLEVFVRHVLFFGFCFTKSQNYIHSLLTSVLLFLYFPLWPLLLLKGHDVYWNGTCQNNSEFVKRSHVVSELMASQNSYQVISPAFKAFNIISVEGWDVSNDTFFPCVKREWAATAAILWTWVVLRFDWIKHEQPD